MPDSCMIWPHSVGSHGYGQAEITIGRRNQVSVLAHRFAYEQANGSIPDGMSVLHTCDEKRCVNPEHLFLGDHKANMADMVAKGRHAESRKTHCPQGHPYSAANTRMYRNRRYCRVCYG